MATEGSGNGRALCVVGEFTLECAGDSAVSASVEKRQVSFTPESLQHFFTRLEAVQAQLDALT